MMFTATGKAKLKSDFIHFHKSCRVFAGENGRSLVPSTSNMILTLM